MSNKIDKSLILNTLKSHFGFNSDSDFARFLGIKPQTLSSWHSRNTFDVDLIYSKCVNIDANFLLSGEGQIEKTKSKENVDKENEHINDHINDHKPNVKKQWSNSEYDKILRKLKFAEGINIADHGGPFYPLPVSAGNTAELIQEKEEATGFISIPGVSCKAYFPVIGFSYEPFIRAGDIIGIDFINRWERLDPDCIYYIITQDNRMLKRLQDDPEDKERLICISPNFGSFPIWKSEIKVIHKVVFYGRLV
ncbi:LexA family transcriptional regulator [Elizabethkingia meningoseptica]|uniref:LexA family transcriptional regulator n=1 Tax=Elizabethkingia meningoseptica TaxID=238 RepID=UPI0023AF8C4E|nr:LexA family transcriptional regulator [Elizabethkingia meningoseptica]MDE5525660.1 helix-turn-helix domain-containing protein [Elizabethkingia meningoseptica]